MSNKLTDTKKRIKEIKKVKSFAAFNAKGHTFSVLQEIDDYYRSIQLGGTYKFIFYRLLRSKKKVLNVLFFAITTVCELEEEIFRLH
jgi:lipoprotein signal peptidase